MTERARLDRCSSADRRLDRRRLIGALALAAGACLAPTGLAAARPTAWPRQAIPDTYAAARADFTARALAAAFDTGEDLWDPTTGYRENRANLARLYDYYGALFLAAPDRFLWAGLARLAGASVIGGLDVLTRAPFPNYPDPSLLTVSFVTIARTVFLDLGWQHEAALADGDLIVSLAREHDVRFPAYESYEAAWLEITRGDTGAIAGGNRALLAIEQLSIIQPFYDAVLADPSAGSVLRQSSASFRRIHPYHRDFAAVVPNGDISDPDQRWAWIDEPDGMWDAWCALPAAERERLVALPLDTLIARSWDPVIEDLVPA